MSYHTFTIHFATINTTHEDAEKYLGYTFTIHFATINTRVFRLCFIQFFLFTIHFATINTKLEDFKTVIDNNLQYT